MPTQDHYNGNLRILAFYCAYDKLLFDIPGYTFPREQMGTVKYRPVTLEPSVTVRKRPRSTRRKV